jgi:hypothetical protein
MARKMIDCRQLPSDLNCTLTIAGEPEDVLDAATLHAAGKHGPRTLPNCASSYAGRSRTPNPRWPDRPDDSGPAGFRWGRCVHAVGAGGRA